MNHDTSGHPTQAAPTRRQFLGKLGQAAAAVGVGAVHAGGQRAGAPGTNDGIVRQRVLGKTGLSISEIGFGGHSWSILASAG